MGESTFSFGFRKTSFSLLFIVGFILVGCQKSDQISDENLVVSGDPSTNRDIGASDIKFRILGSEALSNKVSSEEIILSGTQTFESLIRRFASVSDAPSGTNTPTSALNDQSLVLGLPLSELDKPYLFGGVLVGVSESKNPFLGGLKLSDLPPLNVETAVLREEDRHIFALNVCSGPCAPGAERSPIITMPVVGVDQESNTVLIDLEPLGDGLNLIELQNPQGLMGFLTTKSSKVALFDYSASTLVFDVEANMIPQSFSPTDPTAPEIHFQTRWYLKAAKTLDPNFTKRTPANGVGFFTTLRNRFPQIQRFSLDQGELKYYIKNVPLQYRAAFRAAFEAWNDEFEAFSNVRPLKFEFLNRSDARYSLVVAGDIRYNVVEWDLDNVAPYNAFGPAVAEQQTGQTISGNVLIQGPEIVATQKRWFQSLATADELRDMGRVRDAELELKSTLLKLNAHLKKPKKKFKLELRGLKFRVGSQEDSLSDPLTGLDAVDEIPPGVDVDAYLNGFFKTVIAHELGHNLGLRHNFQGSLGASDVLREGEVSYSIMDYLNRHHKHLNTVGSYDVMAIKYGYAGIAPARTDRFCTDEDSVLRNPNGSAECSQIDSSNDPFGWFQERLAEVGSLLVGEGEVTAPVWEIDDLVSPLSNALVSLGSYANTPTSLMSAWTNFFTGVGRPNDPADVRAYVLSVVKEVICDPMLSVEVGRKTTAEDRAIAQMNLNQFVAGSQNMLQRFSGFSESELSCQ